MKTQLDYARSGVVTAQMEEAARADRVNAEQLMEGIARGEVVLPYNLNHRPARPLAVGRGLFTKVNANIGTSEAYPQVENELAKLQTALGAGASSIMDLSTGGDLNEIRRTLIGQSPVMVGTVPIYQALVEAAASGRGMVEMTEDDIFGAVERHCADGADFITVHCGVTLKVIEALREKGRVMDIVSRGGAFLTAWMLHNQRENPLYTGFDRLLEIAARHDVTLSLGDGLRPGCLADASDAPQIQELLILGQLVLRAREAGVQVMVEGPGHVPMDQIQANVQLEKSLCHGAPFYVLGPVVTDVAPGYDHITSAIGGAIAAAAGADFLCYVTPAEHLGLPTADDVREGVIAARIAAHAADLVKGVPGAGDWDLAMARARKALDWGEQIRLAMDPQRATRLRQQKNEAEQECCTMCGQFCAYKLISEYLGTTVRGKC